RLRHLPPLLLLGLLVLLAALVPMVTSNQYVIRVLGNICLFGLLALGLNVVVGYAGLLDLGYVAFFGIGGYGYALLSSEQFGIHLPSLLTVPLIIVLTALFGLLLGSVSLRLTGDYLAIATLGFAQIFVLLALSMDRVGLPWSEEAVNITGGPNGITNLDRIHLLGFQFTSVTDYLYLLLFSLTLVLLALYHINESRVGRAWRALREDPLAAAAMGIPVRRMKLMAFAIGAAIAGLGGSIFAAWQTAVFPSNFDLVLLITLYAMIVLGGVGSLRGAIAGAILLAVIPELLRGAETARLLFYGALVVGSLVLFRPRWHGVALLGAVILFGLVIAIMADALLPQFLGPPAVPAPSLLGRSVQSWLIFPRNSVLVGNVAFVVVVGLLMVTSRMRQGMRRFVLLVPTLYLLAFVWETRLAAEPSITRLLFFGAILVLLMTYRPQGIFGQPRVEVV
ncbi:MAG: branched-chain amino acid ABC transporter permease, partial [Chloroflexota bacterium]|nr:branched-chain amino acid ABC transporter permease [Chloroflexota bacterium]